MNIKELENYEAQVKEETEFFDEKIKYLDRLYGVIHKIEKPKGFFHKKCPKCMKKLNVTKHSKYETLCRADIIYKHYLCENCDYEYVIKNCILFK